MITHGYKETAPTGAKDLQGAKYIALESVADQIADGLETDVLGKTDGSATVQCYCVTSTLSEITKIRGLLLKSELVMKSAGIFSEEIKNDFLEVEKLLP